ncbi:MAG TPA: LLM class flavin-dependent oxidoreductase [Anaerolineales bacterium]|nr:LLM class flavin-dependent oxidoreductase [Anaerolineales bacterium]
MNFGFVFPFGDVKKAVAYAQEAEQAGWDGFFVADLVWGMDAWLALAAAAGRTERIRLGTMVTPLAWVRPWKLASETVTLDHLSNGRVVLSVGLGANNAGAEDFGVETDRRIKAELVDEGLEILNGLWKGQPFGYDGKHYQIKPTTFPPPPLPVQKPRIPIWVVGAWPREKSMRRVLKCDGLLPAPLNAKGKFVKLTPTAVREMKAYIEKRRKLKTPFDIVVEGMTKSHRDTPAIRKWAEAGATWWIESRWGVSEEAVLKRLKQGPPIH